MEIKLPEISEIELNKIKSEKIKEVLNDDELKSVINDYQFSISDIEKNIYYFTQYLTQRKICDTCSGIANCNKIGCHLAFKLKIDENKNVSTILTKCDKQKELDKILDKFVIRQFDEEILYYPFRSCMDYFAHERHMLIKRLLEFKNNPTSNSLYLFGSEENGKSYILKSFSGFLAKQNSTKSIAFVDCKQELEYLEKMFATDESYFINYLDTMKEVQYLFLDDLGKEFKSVTILKYILIPLIKYRNEKGLVTFISSNYGINDLASLYGFGNDMRSLAYSLMNELKNTFDEYYLNGLKFSILK